MTTCVREYVAENLSSIVQFLPTKTNFSKLEATPITINRELLADEMPESTCHLQWLQHQIYQSPLTHPPIHPSPNSVVEYQTCLTPVFRCSACSASTPLHPALRISTHFPTSIAYLARFEYIAHRLPLVLKWGHRFQCLHPRSGSQLHPTAGICHLTRFIQATPVRPFCS